MGPVELSIRIETLSLPPQAAGIGADALGAAVERELTRLLEREPLRQLPPAGARVDGGAGPAIASSARSPALLARTLARRIHTQLQRGAWT